ncbi:hypothetical protein NOS3756_36320 [Nostoc sp. NIES-3756]|jgi:hypothetical protein|uniref:hypothetical protein n=1 Tax=Nostoc sp. NIES-3756 TaxID=1751286 RepID=UPI00071F2572|nr:hypothetical protein [Nostoc sp. NIES-3756]BAT54660.1 hypothetical protein NOS3756_36320 [Nostoc sp. NIES-3756]BAY37561.1 hypothetical protein NIES2111_19000 [Nostoc sp. NIES-2111]
MSKFPIDLDFSHVDLSSLETEEDVRLEAKKLLPAALVLLGEAVALQTWEELQKNFSGKSSQAEKRKFIQQTGKNYQRSASNREKQELEDHIVEQLRQLL